MENEKKLLEIIDLYTFFDTKRGTVKAVNNVSYTVEEGKTLGVVGESGSGKSVSAMSILRLVDGNGYIAGGQILFNGVDLTKIPLSEMYKIRGNDISVIFQELAPERLQLVRRDAGAVVLNGEANGGRNLAVRIVFFGALCAHNNM